MKDKCISNKNYSHAVDVWKTMVGYHDLDLKTDVLLLADFFEKLINVCLKYYGSDLVTIWALLD